MRNRRVNPSRDVTDSMLNKGTLRVPCAEEGQVDAQENKGSLGERQESDCQAEQKSHFQPGNETHAGIVVLLNEPANGLGQRRLFGRGSGAGGRRRRRATLLGGLQRRDQVGARVGCNVEDGVDAEREEGQGNLARVKPHQSHT